MAYYEILLQDGRTAYVEGSRVESVPIGSLLEADPSRGQSTSHYLLVWKDERLVAWHRDASVISTDQPGSNPRGLPA